MMPDNLKQLLSYDPLTGVFTWNDSGKVAGHNSDGYTRIRIRGRQYLAHRLAWFWVYGSEPAFVDHRNLCKSDNWIDNLRPATRSQNAMNMGPKSNNTSGQKGVSLSARSGKWKACINVDGKQRILGRFKTKEEAVSAYLEAAKEHHGEYLWKD